ncbi:hypothetical protein DYB31_009121 [Aphanomyces astaci]|uniref:EF-hand domain-containing protein n=1 Tax=Aphanomyces astaci TaxID=112090 RepID=A0A397EKZ0_APHAT|nr:hypothetical protein DYB31_009121 [Aphanomyces astaci]
MAATTTMTTPGSRQTVNERIDSILDDFCRASIENPDGGADNDEKMEETKRLSQLYHVALDDRFLKSRVQLLPSPVSRGRQSAISRQKYSRERAALPPTAIALAVTPPSTIHQNGGTDAPVYSPIRASQSTSKLDQLQKQPWYMGHNNVATGPACTLQAKTKRYGARGAVQLTAAATVAGTVPALHRTKLHPTTSLGAGLQDLARFQHPDTWSPTLNGSPTMWSEEAAFVYGAPLAFHNTRQPHLQSTSKTKVPLRPADDHALHVNAKTRAELRQLHASLLQGTTSNDDVSNYSSTWEVEQAVERTKCAASREILDDVMEEQQQRIKLSQHHAKVPAKAMKDWTLVPTTGPPRVAAISTKLMQCKYELRWKTVVHNPGFVFPMRLMVCLSHAGRDLFAKEYPAFGVANFNLMYSSFDPTHTDHLDMRDVISTLKALRMSNANTRASSMKDVVMELIGMYANASSVYVYHVQRVLCSFCGSTDDEDALVARITALFHMYRPFRNLHGRVNMDDVDTFLGDQSALVDVFTENLIARRRQVNSQSLHDDRRS